MQSFLCRVMAFVFAFNCLAPAPGAWAQTAARSPINSAKLKEQLNKNISQQMQDSVAQAVEALQNAQSVTEMRDAINKLHKVMDAKKAAEKAQEKAQQRQNDYLVAPRSSTYVAPRVNPNMFSKPGKNEVLARLEKDDLGIDDLMNYIDPFDSDKYNVQNVIYAGEILGNSLDAFATQADPETIAGINLLLPMAQLRTMYRLNQLKSKQFSNIYNVMAVGTLRIAMWKMHDYYNKTQQEDPLMQPQASSFVNKPVVFERNRKWKDGPLVFSIQQLPATKENSFSLPEDIYQRLMQQYLSELSGLKAKDYKEGSGEYQMLMSLAEYAATYALLVSPNKIKDIVKIFDAGPNRNFAGKMTPGKFKQQYSAVLNLIFTTVFEGTKYMAESPTWNIVIGMLLEFSDPAKYSLPTRIFALEAASLLYSSPAACAPENGQAPAYSVFVRCNSGSPQMEKYRATFAKRTVDIYAPLTYTHFASIEDYGLDSEQMKMLADKLAYIYNGFANDDLKMDTSRKRMPGSYVLDKGEDGKTLILNSGNSIPRLLPINSGHQFQQPDGKLKTISGFGKDSSGKWVEMNLSNGLNAKKVGDEYGVQFAAFVGNAIFWIYGGEIFSLIGTAYRSAKGAMIALPKAVKAATTANKGRRALSFGIEIQKGVRFANLSKNLTKNGVALVAERTVEKAVKKTKLPVPQGKAPEMESTFQALNSQRKLKGRYSRWNPRYWIGQKPAPMDRISFYQTTPGFGANAGTVKVTGTSLQNGLKNWDDWRKLRASFQSLQDPSQHAFPEFFDYLTRKTIRQEVRLTQAMNEAAKNGAFNLWAPIKTPTYAQGLAAEGETTTWWNITRLGRPGNELAWEGAHNVILTPSVSAKVARTTAIDPTKMRNAIELTAEEIAAGNWQSKVIGHYFNQVERTGNARYLLPKYVPNANFWQEASSNLSFAATAGKAVASNTRFWQGFKMNTLFFGAWAGLDMLTYQPMRSWMVSAATSDQKEEMAKHGDAFDPKKLEEDNAAYEAEKEELKALGVTVDDNTMTAYNDVSGTQRETSEGALISFPILFTRHSLPEGFGHMSFVSEQDQALYQQMATRVRLNRAMREQKKVIKEKNAEQQRKIKEETLRAWKEELTVARQSWDLYTQASEPLNKRVMALFDNCLKTINALEKSQEPIETVFEKLNQMTQTFEKELTEVSQEMVRMNELTTPVNSSATGEEYDPYADEFFEEQPVEYNPWTQDYTTEDPQPAEAY